MCCKALGYKGKRLSWEFKDLRLNMALFFHLAIFPESWVGCRANDEPDRHTPGPSELAAHDFQVKAKRADEIPSTLHPEGSAGHCPSLFWVHLPTRLSSPPLSPLRASGHRPWNQTHLGSHPEVATYHLG